MAKASTKVVMAGGAAAGTAMIAAAQTKPEDAVSNLAGWLHLLGIDTIPPILNTLAADRWVTWIGVMLIMVTLAWWFRRKWRDRPGTMEGWLSHGERPAPPPPREAVRRVRGYDLTDEGLDGLERVSKALESRKRKRTFTELVLGIHPEVEQLRATMGDPHYREALAKQDAPAKARAEKFTRQITEGMNISAASLGEHLLDQDAKEVKKEQRRALIASGRDLAHRFREEKPREHWETWVRQQRAYMDIQPHLGDEYQASVVRNARTIHFTNDGSSYPEAMFLRELARLEGEWDL